MTIQLYEDHKDQGYFNEKTQGIAGLFKNRCVTDIATLNEGANTIYINAKLRVTICDKVKTKTPLKFIETKHNKKSKIPIHQLPGKIQTMNKRSKCKKPRQEQYLF